jgi:hypothetical protein
MLGTGEVRLKMTIVQPENRFVKVVRGDDNFMMTDGIKLVPRACVEFSELCPSNLILQVQDAIAKGYIKPVAYVKTKELLWEVLEQ